MSRTVPIDAEYLRARREEGATIAKIASELELSSATICKYLKRYGIPDPKLPRGTKPGSPAALRLSPEGGARNARIVEQRRQGMTLAEIGREHGISRQRVLQITRAHGQGDF